MIESAFGVDHVEKGLKTKLAVGAGIGAAAGGGVLYARRNKKTKPPKIISRVENRDGGKGVTLMAKSAFGVDL